MLLSDAIAQMLEEMLEANDGTLDIRRNDMASKLGCAPSQINYVITSRFTPQHGYLVESHRGGGGYVRIVRKEMGRDEYLMHFLHAVGPSLSEAEARAMISNLCATRTVAPETGAAMLGAVSNSALSALTDRDLRDRVRADILRRLVLSQMV